jgi:CRP-like cAMP-binding protein
MAGLLIRKLGRLAPLPASEEEVLTRAVTERVRYIRARTDLIREGDRPRDVYMILDGWAYRYKMLEDGRRQIIAVLVPGDFTDLNIYLLREMDHSIGALTSLKVAEMSPAAMARIAQELPRTAEALTLQSLVSAAIQREWTVNIGQRSATERLAHLFCEIFLRLDTVGLVTGGTCDMPLTQAELAEATGLTAVHVNRTLQELRASGMIVLKGRELTIPDLAALQHAAHFNANYLHLQNGSDSDDPDRPFGAPPRAFGDEENA